MKKKIQESIEVDWADVNAYYVIEELQNLVEKHGDVKVVYDYYGYDGAFDIRLTWKRDETDEEYTRRTHAEQEATRMKELTRVRKEREEYERLKAKFEGK